MDNKEIFKQIAKLQKKTIDSCLATIIKTSGSTPRKTGAKMIICTDGTTYGSIGGGCGEKQVISATLRCLLRDKKPEIITIDLTDDLGVTGGDVCGGRMQVFVEPFIN